MTILPQFLSDAISPAWHPPFRGRIWEYANKLKLGPGYAVQGPLNLATLRHLIEPLEAIYDQSVRWVSIMGAVQTTKSLIPDICVPYWIEHDPGDILWLFETDPKAKKYADERAMPLIRSIPGIYKMLQDVDRHHKTMTRIKFAHCTVTLAGLNESNVQTFPYRYVIIDEAWIARANGLIRQAIYRTRQYKDTCKVIILGQGGWEDEDHDKVHKETDQRVLEWACPSCGFRQAFDLSRVRGDEHPNEKLRGTFSGLSWETNDTTRPNGRWDYRAVGPTSHYRCYQCDARIADTAEIRRQLNDSYGYRVTNPGAEAGKVGFQWPAEASMRIPFADQVVKYLKAKTDKDEMAYDLPMQEFYQKDRGLTWASLSEGGYRSHAQESYDVKSDWPDEYRRYVIADCQKDLLKFHVGVFACAKDGETRELARETVDSFDAIAKLQTDWHVKDQYVFLDCGYRMADVLRECYKRGHEGWKIGGKKKAWFCWLGLKGSGQESFGHPIFAWDKNLKRQVRIGTEQKIFSEKKWFNVSEGKSARPLRVAYVEFSNLHCKDLYRARRDGDSNAPKLLTLPDTLPKEDQWSYWAQTHSEKRVEMFDGRRKKNIWLPLNPKVPKPNHELDKLAMLMAVQALDGIIGAPEIGVPEPEPEQEKAA